MAVGPFTWYHGTIKREFNIELADLTVVSGNNQSGKSAIATGIRLALTGSAPKLGKTAQMHARLIPHGAVRAQAELQGPDGSAEYLLNRTATGGFTASSLFTGRLQSLFDQREDIIVSDTASLLLAGKTARGREELVRRFGQSDADALACPPGLLPDQVSIWVESIDVVKRELKVASAPEILGGMTAWCRTAAAAARKSAAAVGLELKGLTSAKTRPLTGATRAQLEDELAAWRLYDSQSAKRAAVQTASAAAQTILTVDLPRVRAQIVELEGQLIAQHPVDEARAAWQRVATLVSLAEIQLKEARSGCPFCGHDDHDLVKWSKRLEVLVPIRDKRRRLLDDAEVNLQRAETVARLREQEAALLKELAEHQVTTKTELAPKPPRSADQAREDLSRIDTAVALAAKAKDLQLAIREFERRGENISVVSDQIATRQLELISAARGAALDQVNRFMPPGLRAALEVTDTAVLWGVQPDGEAEPSWAGSGSGYEEGCLVAALGAATAQTPLRLVVLDDDYLGAFDASKILDFMAVLQRAVRSGSITQALLFWNRPHELIEARGWRHVILP